MDAAEGSGGSDVIERLKRQLVVVDDVDALARHLLTELLGPEGPYSVRAGALGLIEGGGRRMRVVFSDDDLGGPGVPLVWTHIDGYDDVPFNDVIRTGEPVIGRSDTLEAHYFDFMRARRARGTVSLAVLPLGRGLGSPRAGEAEVPPERPVGALLLCYDKPQGFGPNERRQLASLAMVVGESLRRLSKRLGSAPLVPEGSPQVGAAEMTLPNDERAPSHARHFLRDRLQAWEVSEEAASTAELCLSEVVTNAVIHTGTSAHLAVALIDGALQVRVLDRGGLSRTRGLVAPIREPEDPLRVYGRGLMLVDALSSEWGADTQEEGTSVWFTLSVEDAV